MSDHDVLEELRTRLAVNFGDPNVSVQNSDPREGFVCALSLVSVALKERGQKDSRYAEVLRILADAARNEQWREPLRTSCLLNDVITGWDVTGPNEASKQLLRLIGNCCIDEDESRSLVAYAAFKKITKILPIKSLCSTATSALYNACLDFQPAQDIAALLWIHHELILLASESAWRASNPMIDVAFELAAMLSARAAVLDPTLLDVSAINYLVLTISEVDDFGQMETVIDMLNTYIGHGSVAYLSGDDDSLISLLGVIEAYEEASTANIEDDDERAAFEERLQLMVDTVIEACDHRYLPNKARLLSRASPRLNSWITARRSTLFDGACIILGNFLLEQRHQPPENHSLEKLAVVLLDTITGSSPRASKHAAAGLLTSIVLNTANKHGLMSAGEEAEPYVWTAIITLIMEKDFTLMKDGLVLFRAFVQDSLEACRFIVEADAPEVSRLQRVTERCSEMHGDSPFTGDLLAECARAITAIARVVLRPATDISTLRLIRVPGLLYPLLQTLQHSEDKLLSLDCTVGLTKIALADDAGAMFLAHSCEKGELIAVLDHVDEVGSKETKANCAVLIDCILKTDGAVNASTRERLESLRERLCSQAVS